MLERIENDLTTAICCGMVRSAAFYADHLGTPHKLTGMTGAVVWSAQYAAFGLAQVETEAVVNNLRFPGQYFDAETGLHYNFQRYYEPGIGRYMQPDPIGLNGGINIFTYAKNHPLYFQDHLGLAVWFITVGSGGGSFVWGVSVVGGTALKLSSDSVSCGIGLICWSIGFQVGIGGGLTAAIVNSNAKCCEELVGSHPQWIQISIQTPLGGGGLQIWRNRIGISAGAGIKVQAAYVRCTIATSIQIAP